MGEGHGVAAQALVGDLESGLGFGEEEAVNHHGLGEVEGGVEACLGDGAEPVAVGDVLAVEARSFAAEDDRDSVQIAVTFGCDVAGKVAGVEVMVFFETVAGSSGAGEVDVLEGAGQVVVDGRGFEKVLGAVGEDAGCFAAGVYAGANEAEVVVAHGVEGAGGGSDIAGFFGFDEDEGELKGGHGETGARKLGLSRCVARWDNAPYVGWLGLNWFGLNWFEY